MGTSLREEMISLSLFGGRLALAELILFSVFLTDILLLGIMGEINLSGVLLANAAFVLCYVTALGFLQGALPLAAQRFEAGDRGEYHAIVAMSLLLGGGMAVLVLLIFLVFPVALRLFDCRPDLIAESWRYISWVLPAYMLAMIYIPVRNGVIATGSSRWFLTLSLVTLVLNAGASYVLGFGNDVSTIDNFDVAPVKQGTANIEIITIKPTKGALAIPPDMRWGIRLIITCFAHRIRIAKGNP